MKKYEQFIDFQKFSYIFISKPDQTISEKLKNTYYLFTNFEQKSSYIKDIKHLISNIDFSPEKRKKLQNRYRMYKLTDLAIVIYAIHSLHWHYKNKYFTGAKLVEAYIIGKVIFNVCLIAYSAFFIFKNTTDSIMYEHFSEKEKEWDQRFLKRSAEITFMRDKKKAFEKTADLH
jgi:hypothetical protein